MYSVQHGWEFCWASLQPPQCSGQGILSSLFDKLPLLLLEVGMWEPDWSPTHSLLFPVFQLAAIHRLRAKGQILAKTDPNGVKRKRADVDDVLEIVERVEKNVAQPQGTEAVNGM